MTHIRTTVRNYVVAKLQTSPVTNASTRVFNTRVEPFQPEETLPAINVVTPEERADPPFQIGPISQKAYFTLVIEAIVRHLDNYATDLDALCEQIQNKLDYYLGNNVQSCLYQGTQMAINEEGEVPIALARINYLVEYEFTEKGIPASPDDLVSIHADWDLADPNNGSVVGPDGQIDAQDIIDNLDA